MTPNTMARLQALFDAALELPIDAREEFVATSCADDPVLMRELAALLRREAALKGRTSPALTNPLSAVLADDLQATPLTGLQVGPFVVRELLGRGGMGSVYRAERVDGVVQQQVAIKLVRGDVLDEQTRARFQLERRMLASFDHPNIARLIDANALPDGTPYFVMEYVDGVPITEYCRQRQLDVRGCVQLLRRVCAAVAQAHQHLIVHRDLKPSNILVDANGEPKLLDFGIAKVLPAAALGGSTDTAATMRYFSPHYAAPEQISGAPISVACDVYALGLLLFEVLTGQRPFDFAQLRAGEIERLVTDVPPPAPSTVLARAVPVQPRARVRSVRGELDDVVLRCLRKAPNERYASVEQLDSDLERFLDGRPVLARGGHAWYRMRKFVRRNLLAVVTTTATLVAMGAGLVAFAWQAKIANERADDLAAVADFQGAMLSQIDPRQAGESLSDDIRGMVASSLDQEHMSPDARRSAMASFDLRWRSVNATDIARNLIVETILKPSEQTISDQFAQRPLVAATLRQSLAQVYWDLDLADRGNAAQKSALETRTRLLGKDHPDTLKAQHQYGVLLRVSGKQAEAEQVLRDTLARHRRVFGARSSDTLSVINNLSGLLTSASDLVEAEALLRELFYARMALNGANDAQTANASNSLGMILYRQGRLDEAEPLVRAGFETRTRLLGEDDPTSIISMGNLAAIARASGRFGEAEQLYIDALSRSRRVSGEDHRDTISLITYLGALLRDRGRYEDAVVYAGEALDKFRRNFGEEHPRTIEAKVSLASSLRLLGRLDESMALATQALDSARRVLRDENHPIAIGAALTHAYVLVDLGQFEDAVDVLAPMESRVRATYAGGNIALSARYLVRLGKSEMRIGRYREAERRLVEADAIFRSSTGAVPRDVVECADALAALHAAWPNSTSAPGSESTPAQH